MAHRDPRADFASGLRLGLLGPHLLARGFARLVGFETRDALLRFHCPGEGGRRLELRDHLGDLLPAPGEIFHQLGTCSGAHFAFRRAERGNLSLHRLALLREALAQGLHLGACPRRGGPFRLEALESRGQRRAASAKDFLRPGADVRR